jgi:predicted N-formylglutamate amidohydrolase
MKQHYLLSCEHAGNHIPEEYAHLFKGKEEVLYTHKGIDFGALRLAQHLEEETGLPLYYTTISRLLVEANRSEGNEDLFSEHSNVLPEAEKQALMQKHYYPHRKQVEKALALEIAGGHAVIHLAVHTFTPALDGEVREADLGILFDPKRPLEQGFAEKFRHELIRQNASRTVLFNSPYPGTDDSLPTYLRTKFSKEAYGGLELEVNQKFFLEGEGAVWEKLMQEVSQAFRSAIE